MRFNSTNPTTKTTNMAGGTAYQFSPEQALINHVLNSFVGASAYQDAETGLIELRDLIDKADPRFVAKLALYTRNTLGLRSVSHVLAGEIARKVKGEAWTKDFHTNVVRRVDDVTEIVAYYTENYGKPLPNSLKKGLAASFDKFDRYRLSKYRGTKAKVSLVDVVNLVHPNHNQDIQDLVEGNLKQTDTWESRLSAVSDEDEKADVWKDLLQTDKLGYFALLRNVRNILEQAPEMKDTLIKQLTNEKAIKSSLVMPFRFLSAINVVQDAQLEDGAKVLTALNTALTISMNNVPTFDGKTLVVIDDSASMNGKPIEAASVFGAALLSKNDAELMMFSEDARYVGVPSHYPIDAIIEKIRSEIQAGGTNFKAIFEEANKSYDRIIILSDMQGWIEESNYHTVQAPHQAFSDYKERVGTTPYIYSWDLAGYSTAQLPEDKIFCLSGYSDATFDTMKLLEQDRNALKAKIDEIEL